MSSYRRSKAADDDIAAIAEYTIEAFGVEQAISYRNGLIEAFKFPAEFPRAARERLEIDPPVRAHPYKSHIVIYVIEGDDVLILGIRHGREDWTSSDLHS